MSSSLPIRLLCVDDHRIVIEGLELIIERQPDMTVVATAATGEEAVERFREHRPDVTLMDLQLGTMSGLDAIRAIRREQPDARIIVLTMFQGDEDIFRSLAAGASTYLLKDSLSDDLIRTVREVHAGHHPITPGVKALLANRASTPSLTPREVEVIELIATGMHTKEIAASLGISSETAHVHTKNIFSKLEVGDRMSAVNVARRRGIIHID